VNRKHQADNGDRTQRFIAPELHDELECSLSVDVYA
jgi:hypothetical protein